MVILFLVLSSAWTLVTTWKFTLKLLRYLELLIMYTKTLGITQNPHSDILSNCADWLQLWVNRLISSKSAKIQQQLPANSCISLCIQQVFHKWVLVHYFFALENLIELHLHSIWRRDWSIMRWPNDLEVIGKYDQNHLSFQINHFPSFAWHKYNI